MDADRRRRVRGSMFLAAGVAVAGVLGLGLWAYTRPDFIVSLASLSFLCQ